MLLSRHFLWCSLRPKESYFHQLSSSISYSIPLMVCWFVFCWFDGFLYYRFSSWFGRWILVLIWLDCLLILDGEHIFNNIESKWLQWASKDCNILCCSWVKDHHWSDITFFSNLLYCTKYLYCCQYCEIQYSKQMASFKIGFTDNGVLWKKNYFGKTLQNLNPTQKLTHSTKYFLKKVPKTFLTIILANICNLEKI